jgi:FtsP/CotA-like multicopper oxidase with cupredoxin domain
VSNQRIRLLVSLAAAAVVLLPLGWFWQQSLMPSTYSVMDMGYADYGGGPKSAHGHHGGTSVTDLVADPDRKADITVDLVARQGKVKLASGRAIEGYTLNGKTPGPTITATQGELIEVNLRNASVEDGVSLHWHGVDVPNAEDGVAGVTQDAVTQGGEKTYRFVADQVGTFWYHSHQVSHEQVIGGLLGGLVILPRDGIEQDQDLVGVAHTYRGTRTINGQEDVVRVPAEPGERIRVRIANTDNGAMPVWSSGPFRLLAVDGGDLNQPTPVEDRRVTVPAGGRVDLEVTVPPSSTIRVQSGAATAYVIGPKEAPVVSRPVQPKDELNLLSYGTPEPVPFETDDPDRSFEYSIGQRPGFLDGKPGMWWTVNGHLWPDVPMFTVSEGDVVAFHVENHSGEAHPMHLHGHHAVVTARNAQAAKGSPVWVDSVEVEDGDSVDLVFKADNPGIWMDHCHNLPHAAEGLVAHLMYEGVSTPFKVGGDTDNAPE